MEQDIHMSNMNFSCEYHCAGDKHTCSSSDYVTREVGLNHQGMKYTTELKISSRSFEILEFVAERWDLFGQHIRLMINWMRSGDKLAPNIRCCVYFNVLKNL